MRLACIFWGMLVCVTVSSAAELYPTGDLDQNYKVDIVDLVIFANQWLEETGCVAPNCAELDGIEGVTISDFTFLAANWSLDYGLPLVINEFMASNNSTSGITDPQGHFDDWIEIHNFGETVIDLGGMYLTDDLSSPTTWQFPASTMIDPNGFLVIWADEDITDTPGLHTNFQLNSNREEIGLFEVDGTTLTDSIIFGEQVSNLSYGRWPDGADDLRFFATPTPAAQNDNAYMGVVADTKFSYNRGFYDVSFSLTITCATPGAVIYYTTDGSAPIENEAPTTTGILYTGPISISSNACIRAAAIKPGWLPTNTDTHTYIFDASAEIKAMPLVALVGDPDKTFWGPDGIMSHFTERGIEFERPVSLEIIDLQAGTSLQQDCGIRIHGSDHTRPLYTVGDDWSTCWIDWWPHMNKNKIGFNLWFRSIYDDNRLEYPFFPFTDIDRFKSIVLRQGKNDPCTPFVKDEWARRLFLEMGRVQGTGTFTSLYLNAEYKSYYNPSVRGDEEFYQEWYDTDNTFDVITQSGVRNGDSVAWDSLRSYANTHDLSNLADYKYVAGKFDIPTFIDFLILEIHIGNFDWPGNNWDVHRERSEDGIFRFSVWDAEGLAETWIFGSNGEDMHKTAFEDFPTWAGTPGLNHMNDPISDLYRALADNAEFRQLFGDHVHKHFRNNGVLTESHLLQRWWEVFGEVSTVLPETTHFPIRYVPDVFIPARKPYTLAAFHDNNLFDYNFGYPIFNVNGSYQYGGTVSDTDTITITESIPSGTLYYTTDGKDPRVSLTDSQTNSELILVTEAASKKVLVPSAPLTSDTGSISTEYWMGISGTSVSDLTNSSNYPDNPTSTGSLTSLEIPINTTDNYGTRVRGYLHPPSSGDYKFWIASDDSSQLLLSSNDDPANASQIAYVNGWTNSREWTKYTSQESASISLTAGQTYYIEALHKEGGGGDNLAVSWEGPEFSQEVIEGSYLSPFIGEWTAIGFDDTSWTSGTGGVGYENNPGDPVNYSSLIDTDVKTEMYNVNTTCYIRIPFTMSAQDLAALTTLSLNIRYDDGFIAYLNGVKVAESLADPSPSWDSTSSGQRDDSLCVNVSSIDISDHIGNLESGDNMLSIHGMNTSADSSDFLITAELVATKSEVGSVTPTANIYNGSFNLLQSTELKARILSGTGQWSVLNEARYNVGPVAQNLRISEIMYHPADPNDEFIELVNVGTEPINLNLVRFTNGVDFTFGANVLAVGGRILVVRDQTEFMSRYPAFSGQIAGEYGARLNDAGEKIRLCDATDVVIQEFTYKDDWYDITDGLGFSLTIKNPNSADPNDWDTKSGWRPSAAVGGSPGWDDSGDVPELGSIKINELLAHSDSDPNDWIELYNSTDQPINIGGWFLSDNNDDLMKYEIAAGTTIGPFGYIVITQDDHFGNPADPGSHTQFALSENGESVILHSGQSGQLTGYSEEEIFGASEVDVSFGRYLKSTGTYNFVSMSSKTPGELNAYPKVGPIVISEIMYHPDPEGDAEYIELINISSESVTLYDSATSEPWKITSGFTYTFPSGTPVILTSGERFLLIKSLAEFTGKYGAPVGQYAQWTSDSLSNGGERVEISKPGDVNAQMERQYIRIDRINYDDEYPWPTEPDGPYGNGSSLRRKVNSNYGNDVANWEAATVPSPGT